MCQFKQWPATSILALLVANLLCSHGAAEALNQRDGTVTGIELVVGGTTVATAILLDTRTARDFLSLLPLTLTLEDYHNTEKISGLPRPLATQGAPAGIDPEVGDITYYAPWGNLAIFYRDFGYSKGLVRLGHIASGIERLEQNGSFSVTIQRAE